MWCRSGDAQLDKVGVETPFKLFGQRLDAVSLRLDVARGMDVPVASRRLAAMSCGGRLPCMVPRCACLPSPNCHRDFRAVPHVEFSDDAMHVRLHGGD
jgi:hypothetical protein